MRSAAAGRMGAAVLAVLAMCVGAGAAGVAGAAESGGAAGSVGAIGAVGAANMVGAVGALGATNVVGAVGAVDAVGAANAVGATGSPAVSQSGSVATGTTNAAPTSLPAEISAAWPQPRLVGEGLFRYMAFKVYRARLWAPESTPRFDPQRYAERPFALELRYERSLSGTAIAERSLEEMRRQGPIDDADAARWLARMQRAFPDVQAGDRLVGLHDGAGGVRFFFNGRETAAIAEPRFAQRFFGIWLLPTTSAPALRESLIGPAVGPASHGGGRS